MPTNQNSSVRRAQTAPSRSESTPLVAKEVAEGRDKILGMPAWLLCVMWILFGVASACYMEGWGVNTALYVIIQIVTTIGYGDVTVTGDHMKLWTAAYVVGTLLLIATYLTELGNSLLTVSLGFGKQHRRHMHHIQRHAPGARGPAQTPRSDSSGDDDQGQVEPPEEASMGVLTSFVLFAGFTLAGTLFFALVESCTCSYGVTAVEGCVESPLEMCLATGGITKSWVEAFYLSVITLTTVGFGDHAPKSHLGRNLGCIWMLLGVVATANLMGTVGKAVFVHKRKMHTLNKVSYDVFEQMDVSRDGSLSRAEFRNFALLRFGLVKHDDFLEIDKLFLSLDTDKTGSLTYDEVARSCDVPGREPPA